MAEVVPQPRRVLLGASFVRNAAQVPFAPRSTPEALLQVSGHSGYGGGEGGRVLRFTGVCLAPRLLSSLGH